MEFCRILVMSVVFFLETSSTQTRSSTRGVPPQQQQQRQQRPLSFGEGGDATPGILVIGDGGLHHHNHHHQQLMQLQQPQRTTTGFEQSRNRAKTSHTNSIKNHVISYLNIIGSSQQMPPASSPSSVSDGGQRPEEGRKKFTTRKSNLWRDNLSRKIISFGEKVSNLSDDRVVQFSLSEAASKRAVDSSLSVTEATVSVLFRLNKTANQRMGGAAGSSSSSLLKGHHQRRHTISVYVLNTPKATSDDDGATTTTSSSDPTVGPPPPLSKPVALLTVAPRQTRWLKVLLPTSVAQAAIDSDDQVLRLLITCDTCRDGDEVVTLEEPTPKLPAPLRRPNTRSVFQGKKGGGRQQQGDDQDRRRLPAAETAAEGGYLPYLVVHTKAKPRPVTMTTEVTTRATRRSSCRKVNGC